MKLSDFDYDLPKRLIAQEPLDNRSDSKLLIVDGTHFEHKHFSDIINYFQKGDVLILNNTKVLQARIIGKKDSGGRIVALLFLEEAGIVNAVIKGSVKIGQKLLFDKSITAVVIDKKVTDVKSEYSLKFNVPLSTVLSKIGKPPLPPYIKTDLVDPAKYQTVFASSPGAVAAPTAGLHFTKSLLSSLENKGVIIVHVTLHVSFGTFNSIRGDDYSRHIMDPEYFIVPKDTSDKINHRKGRLFVVGTTSLKTLESVSDSHGFVHPGEGYSNLFIYPGYKFKTKIDGLITNFHVPKSTLLLLVSAFYGKEKIFMAYDEAIKNNYRFFSFGDAMILLK